MIIDTHNGITGIILAGGKSSRMGQDKGLLEYKNISFIKHILNAITPITKKITIITNSKEYNQFGYECIPDKIPDCGPIGGIYTGLVHSKTDYNFIISCDTPMITTPILETLIEVHNQEKQVTFYENTPLIGLYKKSTTSIFLQNIKKQKLKLLSSLEELNTQTIFVNEKNSKNLMNINTQEQYKEALRWN